VTKKKIDQDHAPTKADNARVEYSRDALGKLRTRVTMGAPTSQREMYRAIAKISAARAKAPYVVAQAKASLNAAADRRDRRVEQDAEILEQVKLYRAEHPKSTLRRLSMLVAPLLSFEIAPETLRRRLRELEKKRPNRKIVGQLPRY
jgi:hypothetical protein